jgi:glycosyltransferase involved in cell wall biosynthesis
VISIITANFNKAPYITETIQSVVNQTYQNWELIIVDDGSNDRSVEIAKDFAERNSRIHFVSRNRPPQGGSTCRNIGLHNSQGEYVLFLDSDDLLIEKNLENRVGLMEKVSHLDFAVFPMGTFFKEIGDSKSKWIPPRNNHLYRFLKHDLPWSIMQPIWRRKFLLKLKGFDEDFPRLQDIELHTRALLCKDVKYQIVNHFSSDCYYRIDEKRIVSNHSKFIKDWVDGCLFYIEKMIAEIDNCNVELGKRKKCLRGTILTMINQLLYRRRCDQINEQEAGILLSKILKNTSVRHLLSQQLILWYISLTKLGLYRVKGFNWFVKRILTF